RSEIQNVLVVGEASEEVVHRSDGGDVVAFLNVDQPVDQKLLVWRSLWRESLGALQSRGGRLVSVCGVRPNGVGQGEVGILCDGLAGVFYGQVEEHILVLIDGSLDQLAGVV